MDGSILKPSKDADSNAMATSTVQVRHLCEQHYGRSSLDQYTGNVWICSGQSQASGLNRSCNSDMHDDIIRTPHDAPATKSYAMPASPVSPAGSTPETVARGSVTCDTHSEQPTPVQGSIHAEDKPHASSTSKSASDTSKGDEDVHAATTNEENGNANPSEDEDDDSSTGGVDSESDERGSKSSGREANESEGEAGRSSRRQSARPDNLAFLLAQPSALDAVDEDEDDGVDYSTYEGDGRPLEIPIIEPSARTIAKAEEWFQQLQANPDDVPVMHIKGPPIAAGIRAAQMVMHVNKRLARSITRTSAFQQIAAEPQTNNIKVAFSLFMQTFKRNGASDQEMREALDEVMKGGDLNLPGCSGSHPEAAALADGNEAQPRLWDLLSKPGKKVGNCPSTRNPSPTVSASAASNIKVRRTSSRGLLPIDKLVSNKTSEEHSSKLKRHQALDLENDLPTMPLSPNDIRKRCSSGIAFHMSNDQLLDALDLKEFNMDDLFSTMENDAKGMQTGRESVNNLLAPFPTITRASLDGTATIIANAQRENALVATMFQPSSTAHTLVSQPPPAAPPLPSGPSDNLCTAVMAAESPTDIWTLPTSLQPATAWAAGAMDAGPSHGAVTGKRTARDSLSGLLEGAGQSSGYDLASLATVTNATPVGVPLNVTGVAPGTTTLAPLTAEELSIQAQIMHLQAQLAESRAKSGSTGDIHMDLTTRENKLPNATGAQMATGWHAMSMGHAASGLKGPAGTRQAPVVGPNGWQIPADATATIATGASAAMLSLETRQHSLLDSVPGAWVAGKGGMQRTASMRLGAGGPCLNGPWYSQGPHSGGHGVPSLGGFMMAGGRPWPQSASGPQVHGSSIMSADAMAASRQKRTRWTGRASETPFNMPSRTAMGGAGKMDSVVNGQGISNQALTMPWVTQPSQCGSDMWMAAGDAANMLDAATLHAMLDDLLPPDVDMQQQQAPQQAQQLLPTTIGLGASSVPSTLLDTTLPMPPPLDLADKSSMDFGNTNTTATVSNNLLQNIPGLSRLDVKKQNSVSSHTNSPVPAPGAATANNLLQLNEVSSIGYVNLMTNMNLMTGPSSLPSINTSPPMPVPLINTHSNINTGKRSISSQAPQSTATAMQSKLSPRATVGQEAVGTPTSRRKPGVEKPAGGGRTKAAVTKQCQPKIAAQPLVPLPSLKHQNSVRSSDAASEDGINYDSEKDALTEGEHVIRTHLGSEPRKINKQLLQEVYHLPINEAADQLGIGVTVLKKYCRRFNIDRWPYRKLKSMDKLIQSVEEQRALDPQGTSFVLAKLHRFKQEVYANPEVCFDEAIKKLRQANFKMEYKQRQASAVGTSATVAAAVAEDAVMEAQTLGAVM